MEVVLAENSREVVLRLSLNWSSKCLESCEGLWIMDALFKEIEFRLAHSHLPIHLEHALTSIIKWIEADWLELQIL